MNRAKDSQRIEQKDQPAKALRNPMDNLEMQYAELLRLRREISQLSTSATRPTRMDQ